VRSLRVLPGWRRAGLSGVMGVGLAAEEPAPSCRRRAVRRGTCAWPVGCVSCGSSAAARTLRGAQFAQTDKAGREEVGKRELSATYDRALEGAQEQPAHLEAHRTTGLFLVRCQPAEVGTAWVASASPRPKAPPSGGAKAASRPGRLGETTAPLGRRTPRIELESALHRTMERVAERLGLRYSRSVRG